MDGTWEERLEQLTKYLLRFDMKRANKYLKIANTIETEKLIWNGKRPQEKKQN